jgi:hypothetical protein
VLHVDPLVIEKAQKRVANLERRTDRQAREDTRKKETKRQRRLEILKSKSK